MHGYIINIEKETEKNADFRRVLYTARHSQLVVMSLAPGEDIGEEVHTLDQFIRCEAGEGSAVLNGEEHAFRAGDAVIIPAGTKHNVRNASSTAPMKLYTVYAPPAHRDGVTHHTKADAERNEEHFDGKTTQDV